MLYSSSNIKQIVILTTQTHKSMKTQTEAQNLNLGFNYENLDEFLLKTLSHQDLRYWLNEIECEILAPSNDSTDLVVDSKVWELFRLLKELIPTKPSDPS